MRFTSKQYLLKLVEKLFDGSISKKELDKLLYFFINNQKLDTWPEAIGTKEVVKDKIYERIQWELQKKKVVPLYKKPFFKYAVAAMLVLCLALTLFFQKQDTPEIMVTNNTIEAGTDKAVLTLEDGTDVVLTKGKTITHKTFNSTGKQLLYKSGDAPSKDMAYNYLTVPRGGQYFVELSDGTQVWLNSESKLKYPVNFIAGQTRIVELLYGEAYFDVSHSTEHHGHGFKVIQNKQEVCVLGTEFNVKAYKDESRVYTTLVTGRVAIQYGENKQILAPNQQADFDAVTNSMSISNVNVYNEVSWKDGVFSFEDKSLVDIMKVLSRWYNMDVVYKSESIKQKEFVGVLFKDRSIEDILTSIKNSGAITDYELNQKILILK